MLVRVKTTTKLNYTKSYCHLFKMYFWPKPSQMCFSGMLRVFSDKFWCISCVVMRTNYSITFNWNISIWSSWCVVREQLVQKIQNVLYKSYSSSRSRNPHILLARALIWLIGYRYQKMEEGFRIYVNAGKLLQNLPQTELANNWEKDLLDTIKANFKYITGLVVNSRKFRSLVKKYVNKIKKNKGHLPIGELLADWFKEYVSVDVESDNKWLKRFTEWHQLPLPPTPVTTRKTSLVPLSTSSSFTPTVPSTPSTPLTSSRVNLLTRTMHT